MPTYGFDGSVDEVAMAKIARYAGADYAVADASSWRVSAVAGQDRTVQIAAGTGYGHFILDEDTPTTMKQAPVLASGKRWDLVARRRVWTPPGGTSDFTIVAGVAAADPQPAIPAARLHGAGASDDQLLALVQFVAGQPTPAQIIDLRSFPSMVLTATSLLALVDAKLGAEAIVGGVRYHRELDGAGNPVWVSPKTSAQTVKTNTTTPATGFVLDTGFVNRCIIDPTGKDVHYDVELRRTGTSIGFGGSGAVTDVKVATLTGGVLPDANLGFYSVPVTFRARGGGSSSSTSGVYCHGYLTPGGDLYLEAGIPDGFVSKQSTAGSEAWSLQAHIAFRKA